MNSTQGVRDTVTGDTVVSILAGVNGEVIADCGRAKYASYYAFTSTRNDYAFTSTKRVVHLA
jgi:hypothetical protein